MNSSAAAINSTKAYTYDSWTFLPSFSVAVLLAAILTNSTVLYLFFKHRDLRTAFTVYLINLLLANLVNQLIQIPIYLVANLRPVWWIGRPACSAYIYGFFIQAGMCNAHALISVNRIWAVFGPISYRRLHTKRTAWIICGVMWLYVHVLTLPGFIDDILYYRLPENVVGCFLNKMPQMGWAYMNQFVVFNLPVIVVLFTYPVISFKIWMRQRQRRQSVRPAPASVKSKPTETDHDGPSEAKPTGHAAADVENAKPQKSHSFLILTVVTGGMLVFWGPSLLYYTVVMLMPMQWAVFQQVATVLWFLESIVDPILFTLAIRDLRMAMSRLCHH